MERFWTFLTTLDSNIVAKFMKDNLAGTVVVFSLLIWIPASCYINRLVSKVISFRAGERVCVSLMTLPTPPWQLLHKSFLQLRWIPLSRNFYVSTQVNFTRVNKMEAMYAWSRVTLKLKVRVVQLVLSQWKYAFSLRATLHTFPLYYLRT